MKHFALISLPILALSVSAAYPGLARASEKSKEDMTRCNPYLQSLNHAYLERHEAKENAFWAEMMGHAGRKPETLTSSEQALKTFTSDPSHLDRITTELKRTDLSTADRTGLEGWKHYFEIHTVRDPKALALRTRLIEIENLVRKTKDEFQLTYIDAVTGETKNANLTEAGTLLSTSPSEVTRKSIFESFGKLERHILEKTDFLKMIGLRNEYARLMGFSDFYEMKVQQNEGMSKATLFATLDDLRAKSTPIFKERLKALTAEKGAALLESWNFRFMTAGDIKREVDPYFPFSTSVQLWGEMFRNLGIKYNGATLQLDLVNRNEKYQNGFMHGPVPGYIDGDTYLPARINFTANAVPGQVGSGHNALTTLVHEGGHAAHFSNIFMPAPSYSQEFAPSSVAMAETQSMLLDSLVDSPEWLIRYAETEAGQRIPKELVEKYLVAQAKLTAIDTRGMLVIPYGEKILYEMPDADRTPEKVLSAIRDVEKELTGLNQGGARPMLVVPHVLSEESSAYYHGYVLATMALEHTKAYFEKNFGVIIDNPKVGEAMAEIYWREGNLRPFHEFVKRMTGTDLSADALVASMSLTNEGIKKSVDAAVKWDQDTRQAFEEKRKQPIALGATIKIVHGDLLVSDSTADGSFEAMSKKFADWLKGITP